jgi:hypothetical protein
MVPYEGAAATGGGGTALAATVRALEATLCDCKCSPGRSGLRVWLDGIGLGALLPHFVVAGFDDLRFLLAAGLSEADVGGIAAAAGIQLGPGHVRKLTSLYGAAEALKQAEGGGKGAGGDDEQSGSEGGGSDEDDGSDDGSGSGSDGGSDDGSEEDESGSDDDDDSDSDED